MVTDVPPEIRAMVVSELKNVTGSFEEELAVSLKGALPKVWAAGALKVMVCDFEAGEEGGA
jgi:hypothetical protein